MIIRAEKDPAIHKAAFNTADQIYNNAPEEDQNREDRRTLPNDGQNLSWTQLRKNS